MAKRHPEARSTACPCGGGSLTQCCGPLIDGREHARSAERLMRSRYSAYVLGAADYLLATWHPATRPASLDLGPPQPKWIGLTVRRSAETGAGHAEVEFVARYRVAGRAARLHETSRFECIEGRWYYRDGDIHDT